MTAINYPCKCKHSKINHTGLYIDNGIHNYICSVFGCHCDNFIADNLGYLEKQYESKSTD
jgi:hypothetical protein